MVKVSVLLKGRRILQRLLPLLFLGALIATLLIGNIGALAQTTRPEIRGVWMTVNDKNILRDRTKVVEAMQKLRRLNFNTIYPVVWNSGYVMYDSAVAKRNGIQPFVYKGFDGHDILADVTNQAHRQKLLAIPWFEFGFMAPPTSELATAHPQWLTQRRDGSQTSMSAAGEVVWLNPFHPQVQQLITDLVIEIVSKYNVDGIQFDDHMSLPRDFGYDKYTIALYTQETKLSPPTNPQDPAWMRWRADKITAFMLRLHQAAKTARPNLIFSIAPAPYDAAYRLHLQDWLSWVRLNIVDELIVQVYRPDVPSFVAKIIRPEIIEAQQKIPTAIGIITGLRNRPVSIRQIQLQARAAKQRGLGVSFFYYESLWNHTSETVAQRQSGFQALFPSLALRATR